MNVIKIIEGRIDRGLALALPALVVVSCLLPLLGLALSSMPYWVPLGIVLLTAIGACTALLHGCGRDLRRSLSLSVAGVALGSGGLLLVTSGINALGASAEQSTIDIADRITTAIPVLLIALALLAIVLTFNALPQDRLTLGIAWAIAIAVPFVLAVPVSILSDEAGNAGMDVIGLFVLPLAAFFVWFFLLAGSFVSRRTAESAEAKRR